MGHGGERGRHRTRWLAKFKRTGMEGEEEEKEKEQKNSKILETADFNERDTAEWRRTRPEEGQEKERWQMERGGERRTGRER